MENPALIGRPHRLCVLSWLSRYVRQRRDGYHLSSEYWQAHVRAYGYILSCLTLNDCVSQGCQFLGHLPRIIDTRAWLSGTRELAELGHNGELGSV
jgi:hypothetical protein